MNQMATATEPSRTDNCEQCGTPTSFERVDPKTQPPEGEVCEQCGMWVCPDCTHSIGEPCPQSLSAASEQPPSVAEEEQWRVVQLGRNTYIERDGDSPFVCDMQTGDCSDAERAEAVALAKEIVRRRGCQIRRGLQRTPR
jgi:hypothetical protein